MNCLDAVAAARARDRRAGDGSFEKCADASLAMLLPLLGAGAGAGVGAYANKVRPEDEDEDAERRKLESVLFGAGAGALGGAGLSAISGLLGQGGQDEPKGMLSHLDPSWRSMVGFLGIGNAVVPRDGIHSWRRIFNSTKDTKATGTWAGQVRDSLGSGKPSTFWGHVKDWRRMKAIAGGYDPLPEHFVPNLLFSDANKGNIHTLIDAVYNGGAINRQRNTANLSRAIMDIIDRTSDGSTDVLRNKMVASLKSWLTPAQKAALPPNPTLADVLNSGHSFRPKDIAQALTDAGGQNIVGNLRKHEFMRDNVKSRGFFSRFRSPVARTASGIIGTAALFPGLFGMVAPESKGGYKGRKHK